MSSQTIDEPQTQVTTVVRFGATAHAIAELREQATALLPVDTPEGYEQHRAFNATMKRHCGDLERTKKALKADIIAEGRAIDTDYNHYERLLRGIQEPVRLALKAVDDAKEAAALAIAKAEQDRLAKIEAERVAAIEAERQARIEAEQEKLALERAEIEAQRKAMEAENARRNAEYERQRQEEAARAKAERERIDELHKQERERFASEQKRLDDERRDAEDERRKLQAEHDRLERIEFERVAKERAEAQAKERAAKAEAERIEVERLRAELAERNRIAQAERMRQIEEAAALERARLEAMRPDVEKIRAFGQHIKTIGAAVPVVANMKARKFLCGLVASLGKLAQRCEEVTAAQITSESVP